MIQSSILKQNNLKKILVINYLSRIGAYFSKWRNTFNLPENNLPFQNQFIIEKLLNSNSVVNNFILDKKISSLSKESNEYNLVNKTSIVSKERFLNKLLSTKLKNIYTTFFINLRVISMKKKVIKAYLSLFITHSNGKMKLKKIHNDVKLC